MCGIIGVELSHITPAQLVKIKELIHQSSIRGVHATGFSYLKAGRVSTVSKHGNADEFLAVNSLEYCVDRSNLSLIAHTRYSTSDLKYNQPIGRGELAICHNGVISQADPKLWPKLFGLQPRTSNDSELILNCIEKGECHPLIKFKGSMAVCVLTLDGVSAFRNHERPLWFNLEENGVVFASTRDILFRSGFDCPQRCEMFCEYTVDDGMLIRNPYPIPEGTIDLQ